MIKVDIFCLNKLKDYVIQTSKIYPQYDIIVFKMLLIPVCCYTSVKTKKYYKSMMSNKGMSKEGANCENFI